MILIPLILLLFANVVLAGAQNSAPGEFPCIRINGFAFTSRSVYETDVTKVSSLNVLGVNRFQEPYRQLGPSSSLTRPADFMTQGEVPRSGTGRFIMRVVAGVMLVAVPVAHFISEYSSYDSGSSQYSRPAIDIRPNFTRRSAWVSAQLRI